MRGRNSSRYYRKNSYKKRKLRNILIIAAVSLVVLFLLFIVWGNALNKKTKNETGGRDKSQTTAQDPINTATYSIEAYPVDISPSGNVTTRIQELSGMGVRAVSFKLTDSKGKLLVHSDLAVSLGYQSKGDSLRDVSSVISTAKYYNMFSSAVLDLQFPSESDAKQRSVMLAYEAAITVEMSEKGVGEVIVRVSSVDAAETSLLIDFANNVRSINDAVVLGVALPIDFFYQESSSEAVAALAEVFDIIGVDTSNIPDGTKDALEYIDGVFSESNLKYYVLRYNMRVLLPQISEEQDSDMKTVLSENSIENWQKIS